MPRRLPWGRKKSAFDQFVQNLLRKSTPDKYLQVVVGGTRARAALELARQHQGKTVSLDSQWGGTSKGYNLACTKRPIR
jgi:hypothetical protein